MPHRHGQMIFDKVARLFNGETVLTTNRVEKTGYSHAKA